MSLPTSGVWWKVLTLGDQNQFISLQSAISPHAPITSSASRSVKVRLYVLALFQPASSLVVMRMLAQSMAALRSQLVSFTCIMLWMLGAAVLGWNCVHLCLCK